MKFTEFRKLIEEYKKLILENKKEEAKLILEKVDPNNLGIKRFFIVKKHRVEKVIEKLCEDNNFKLRYEMVNMTNRGYDFIITIENYQRYIIRCNTKKAVGYIHLKSLYREPDYIDGINKLINDYPEIVDGLWEAVLKTNNEQKHRKIASISIKIMHNEQDLTYANKEASLISQLIAQYKKEKQEIVDSLDDIDVENVENKKP